MAGYSGTPLAKKLGIKPGHRVALVHAPKGFALEVPDDVSVSNALRAKAYDVIVLFAKNQSVLEKRFETAQKKLIENGGLWIAWPKKSSGVKTDLSDGVVRPFGLGMGLVDNKVCAIDETWSGLRFVVRVKDRKKKKK